MAKKRYHKIAEEFNTYFGAGTVQDWQRLCRDVGLNGDYTSIKQCRKALHTIHVNIYDLLDAVGRGETPRRFGNARQLAEYSRQEDKIFPRKKAKQMGPVRALLRMMF